MLLRIDTSHFLEALAFEWGLRCRSPTVSAQCIIIALLSIMRAFARACHWISSCQIVLVVFLSAIMYWAAPSAPRSPAWLRMLFDFLKIASHWTPLCSGLSLSQSRHIALPFSLPFRTQIEILIECFPGSESSHLCVSLRDICLFKAEEPIDSGIEFLIFNILLHGLPPPLDLLFLQHDWLLVQNSSLDQWALLDTLLYRLLLWWIDILWGNTLRLIVESKIISLF